MHFFTCSLLLFFFSSAAFSSELAGLFGPPILPLSLQPDDDELGDLFETDTLSPNLWKSGSDYFLNVKAKSFDSKIYTVKPLSSSQEFLVMHKLKRATIEHILIPSGDMVQESFRLNDKPAIVVDGFFSAKGMRELQQLPAQDLFPLKNIASQNSAEQPTGQMEFKKARALFVSGRAAFIEELQGLLAILGMRLHALVSTIPGFVCDEQNRCRSAFPTNLVSTMTRENALLTIHQDYSPANISENYIMRRLGYGDKLASRDYFPPTFENGGEGAPMLLSVLVYGITQDFKGSGLGTILFAQDKDKKLTDPKTIELRHGRILIFDGSIYHTIEPGVAMQGKRVSFVYKIIVRRTLNHVQDGKSIAELLREPTVL